MKSDKGKRKVLPLGWSNPCQLHTGLHQKSDSQQIEESDYFPLQHLRDSTAVHGYFMYKAQIARHFEVLNSSQYELEPNEQDG